MEISTQRTKASPPLQRRNPKPRGKDYSGPLGILAAAAIGLSLLCSVSAMAMGDLNRYVSITLEPLNIVDLAVSNLETAAALTEQAVTVFVPTETLVPTSTASLTPLPLDTSTSTLVPTRVQPTATRREREAPTKTSAPPPTKAPTHVPTRTPTPVPPTATKTDVPPTETNTPVPPPTDTPVPPPTDTPVPPPTDTSVPPPTPQPTVETPATAAPAQATNPSGPDTSPSATPGP